MRAQGRVCVRCVLGVCVAADSFKMMMIMMITMGKS